MGAAVVDIDRTTSVLLESAKAFTRAYREHLDDHVAVREAYALMGQYPALFRGIEPCDLIAGRRYYRPLAGFSAELNANHQYRVLGDDPGYEWKEGDAELRATLGISNSGFCHDHKKLMDIAQMYPEGSPERVEIEELVAFWDEHSLRRRYNELLTDEVLAGLGRTTGGDTRLASGFIRQDCYSLHFDRLLRLGVPGMRELIERTREDARAGGGDAELYTGMLLALDVLVSVFRKYEREARELLGQCTDPVRRRQLETMVDTLRHVARRRPETLQQAIQLFWIYDLIADTPNYGRMDVYLGDFYCRDIDNGVLTREEAHELLCSLWRMISEIRSEGGPSQPNSRLVIGGRGRRNERNANRFAMAAMDVVRAMRVNEPNVTLRFYDGQDEALMQKAITLLGEGCIHPGLYNDDEHVPMVRDYYRVPEEDAEQYLPEGCGEILIDHMGFGSPNSIFVFPTALDLVLHNGVDTVTGERRGLALGDLGSFDTFERLVEAWKAQVDFTNDVLAKRHAIEHQAEREKCAFLFMSMLSDDCIERGKALFDGGVRYLGGVIETFGLTNTADSLAAIKELVYDRKVMTLRKLVEIVDADFEGYEKERRMMLACPKFGNDDDAVDALHTELGAYANASANAAGRRQGLHFFLNCNLNPGGVYYAPYTKASSDGRRAGEPMALGNAPAVGKDTKGITALLNSMAKHQKGHAGYVQNLKVTKAMFSREHRPRFEAILDAYFKNGGLQLMVTALNRDDLENALKEPEKYANLQVRVAGWTAKFVALAPRFQQDVLNRTMHG
jgi:pyruvate-formate lyase